MANYIKSIRSIKFETFETFFQGFEKELELISNSKELVVWKGGISRNVGRYLLGLGAILKQKDLDLNLNPDGELIKNPILFTQDIRGYAPNPDRPEGSGGVDWEGCLEGENPLNCSIVVQIGRRVVWVEGSQFNAFQSSALQYYGMGDYELLKREWRALVFAYRYRGLGVKWKRTWPGEIPTIGYTFGACRAKVKEENWDDFCLFANRQIGVEVLETQLRYWEEASHWFPGEGY